jgi:hypothetical protein
MGFVAGGNLNPRGVSVSDVVDQGVGSASPTSFKPGQRTLDAGQKLLVQWSTTVYIRVTTAR